jgi:hypothetical protein
MNTPIDLFKETYCDLLPSGELLKIIEEIAIETQAPLVDIRGEFIK